MATEERSDAMKATNVSLTPPDADARSGGDANAPAQSDGRETVETGRTPDLTPPGYAAPPGRRIDRETDPAAPPDATPYAGPAHPHDADPPAMVPAPTGKDQHEQSRRGDSTPPGGEVLPNARTRPGPDAEQRSAKRPQTQYEPKPPLPPQHQGKPGLENELHPRPHYMAPLYKPAGKLEGKVALITGGDSGIGRAVAVLYAREGADVAIVYLPTEQSDALETQKAVQEAGRRCVLMPGDLTDPTFCRECIECAVAELGKLDILVSNAAWQNRKESLVQVDEAEWDTTFKTNIYAYFHLAKAAIPHLKPGSAIIATSSETGLLGNKSLPDYSATKGAINAFSKALAQQLVEKGIRVNVVAPGPVWTPLNPADEGATPEKIRKFGQDVPMGRPAQPEEIAPAYVFLASDADSSYITGIVLEQMGGQTTAG